MSALCQLHLPQQWPNLRNAGPIHGIRRYSLVTCATLAGLPELCAVLVEVGHFEGFGGLSVSVRVAGWRGSIGREEIAGRRSRCR